MIKYIKGDLFTTDAEIIAHGCNCVGGFGSGVAGIIASKYPNVKVKYLAKHTSEGWKLGDIQPVKINDTQYIVNCATQFKYYPRNVVHADYKAIEEVLIKLKEFAKENNYRVAIPKIGAGLAGGDWNKIESIINRIFNDYDITVYYLN